jgi:SnoaL-like protein
VTIDDDLVGERIRRGFEFFNARDWDVLERGFSPEFQMVDRVPPDVRIANGPGALREITEAAGDFAFADLVMEPVEIQVLRPATGGIAAAVRIAARATGGTSDIPVEDEIAQTWTFDEEGVPLRVEQFRRWTDALEAARS